MFVRRVIVDLSRHQSRLLSRGCSSTASSQNADHGGQQDLRSGKYKVPDAMKAWNLTSYSGISGLELTSEAPVPIIHHGQDLLIQVKAASINPLDELMSRGYGFSLFETMQSCSVENFSTFNPFPITLGRDFSGIVVDKGMDANEYNVGDQVWGSLWPSSAGSHAEYVVASKISISKKPASLSHTEAASIPYAALTGWSAIVTTGNLTSSSRTQRVLVIGAAGGVGTFAVQLLKHWEHEVVAVCGGGAVPLVESLGAESVLDYTRPDFDLQLAKAGQFDLILDFSGGKNDATYLPHLRKNCGSKFVSTSSPLLTAMDKKGILFGTFDSAMELITKNLNSLRDQSATYRWAYYSPNPSALSQISKLVDEGKIRPHVEKVYPMSQLKEAFQRCAQGGARGKLVVEF